MTTSKRIAFGATYNPLDGRGIDFEQLRAEYQEFTQQPQQPTDIEAQAARTALEAVTGVTFHEA